MEDPLEVTLRQRDRDRFHVDFGDGSGEIFEGFCTVTASARVGLDVEVDVEAPVEASHV